MAIFNDRNIEPKWADLAKRPLDAVERGSLARWDGSRGCWVVDFLTDSLAVDVKARTVTWSDRGGTPGRQEPSRDVALLVLDYLANAQDVPGASRWVTGKDLPSGAFFFRGPHDLPEALVARRFAKSPDEFRAAATLLGGRLVAAEEIPGDAAAVFRVLPRVEVAVSLWRADEEFPARATILFDASVPSHLKLDGIFLVALQLVLRLIRV
jgi:hypothetical protein